MNQWFRRRLVRVLLPVLPVFLWMVAGQPALCEPDRVSEFGRYEGYVSPDYDGWVRTSKYLTMRDGIRLAVDILRPSREGEVEEKPLPVIWSHNRYRRAFMNQGKLITMGDSPHISPLILAGYVYASADVRGSGASFGSWQGIFTPEETRDAREIIEWLARQPWCDGEVGMYGGSYLGGTQLMAASTHSPHLRAIFPMVPPVDLYEVAYHGGIFYDDFISTWSRLTEMVDTRTIAAPVDGDPGGVQLQAAVKEHEKNRPLIDIFSVLPHRDSRDPVSGEQPYMDWNPANRIEAINESGVAVYLWCNWFDAFVKNGLQLYQCLETPRRVAVGSWSHAPTDPELAQQAFRLMATEAIRWFDYWLKVVANGIMDEPPVVYHRMKGPGEAAWCQVQHWPPAGTETVAYHLESGKAGSVSSINDGRLVRRSPVKEEGRDCYTVDYSTTTGTRTRWDNTVGGSFGYPDLRYNDEKGLTYTTEPLEEEVTVTGHPVLHLWVGCTGADADLFAYLEEVEKDGTSRYISEGTLRISFRERRDSPFGTGLPYHRGYREDVRPLIPGEVVELVFDLMPTSNVFDAGHRIRLTITGADRDNAATPEQDPAPVVSVYRNNRQPSRLELPLVQP